MKRKTVSIFLGTIFLFWNILTYIFISSKPPSKNEYKHNLLVRLETVENELLKQTHIEQNLLTELEIAKRFYARNSLKSNISNPSVRINYDNYQHLKLPILVIACDRVTISRNIDQLLKYRPSEERFPIIVSQDCAHQPTASVIRTYGSQIKHIQHPDLSDISLPAPQRKFKGYYKISRHYKWALKQIFSTFNFSTVIIIEDDLDIAPDFFEYFSSTFPILHEDPSLWCVSAWNDNGKANTISNDPELLYRTDFFPGLGWMLEKSVWLELDKKWPATFWDDWMRNPEQRKGRACIRPEISRTRTFGKKGVSKGQFYEKHLKFIQLNSVSVPFSKKDMSYLLKENYDPQFVQKVYNTPELTIAQVLSGAHSDFKSIRVQYSDKATFKAYAKQLGLMDDLKSGVPRGGYRGVVSFFSKGRRTYLAPPANWKEYDRTWN